MRAASLMMVVQNHERVRTQFYSGGRIRLEVDVGRRVGRQGSMRGENNHITATELIRVTMNMTWATSALIEDHSNK